MTCLIFHLYLNFKYRMTPWLMDLDVSLTIQDTYMVEYTLRETGGCFFLFTQKKWQRNSNSINYYRVFPKFYTFPLNFLKGRQDGIHLRYR